ncbi:MAG: hypothetical protein ACLTXH_02695 [Enterobacter hormaechei]
MWVINEINSRAGDPLPRYSPITPGVRVLYRKDKLPLKVQVVINYLTDYFVESELFQGARRRKSRLFPSPRWGEG